MAKPREHVIKIRVHNEELALLHQAADIQYTTISTFMRSLTLRAARTLVNREAQK